MQAVDFGDYYPIESLESSQSLSTCARMQTGDVKCWGENTYGQLGVGDKINRGHNVGDMGNTLPLLDFGTNYVSTMSYSDRVRCALLDNGKVKCWGVNNMGMLGLGHMIDNVHSPGAYVLLGTTSTVKQVKCGNWNTCVLFKNNNIKCWGIRDRTKIHGYGDDTNRGGTMETMGDNLPFISFEDRVVALQVSDFTSATYLMFEDGRMKCWGNNAYGNLGQGTSISTPVNV
ncbi:regulator of chromosome condensation 1/beta-lactamase-inhibitor protein II, partial [Baffinella frigidus]